MVGTRRELVQAIRNLHLAVQISVSTVTARERATESAENALIATKAGYEAGTRNLVDVINAERTFFQSKRDYLNSRYDYIIALLSLKGAAGTLSTEDVATANDWVDPTRQLTRKEPLTTVN